MSLQLECSAGDLKQSLLSQSMHGNLLVVCTAMDLQQQAAVEGLQVSAMHKWHS